MLGKKQSLQSHLYAIAARTAGRQPRDIYMRFKTGAGHVCFSTWSLPVSAEALWDGIVPSHGLRELVAAATQHPPQARRQHGTRRAEEPARHLSLDRSRAVVYKHGSVAPRAVQARCVDGHSPPRC